MVNTLIFHLKYMINTCEIHVFKYMRNTLNFKYMRNTCDIHEQIHEKYMASMAILLVMSHLVSKQVLGILAAYAS